MQEIQDFVLRYPNIETGGDLFGLWRANGDPVVQLLIGPGENCRRTAVSFHQDTNYLARVGTYVNSHLMLCHIGSWHSHHQLSLTQPSAGDRSTVCNNYPEGLKQYIMIIVNITRGTSGRQSVLLNPYMFTEGGHVCKKGKVERISLKNPFRQDGNVINIIGYGKEKSLAKDAYASRAPLEYQNRPSTQSKLKSRAMEDVDQPTRSKPMCQNYISTNYTAPRDSPMVDNKPVNYRNTQEHSNRTWSRHHMNENMQWYNTEEGGSILKEIHQEVAAMASNVAYDRGKESKDLKMEFIHGGQHWKIQFPKSFGNMPAVITSMSNGKQVPSTNIIKDVRKLCGCSECRTSESADHPSVKEDHPYSSGKQESSTLHSSSLPKHPRQSPPLGQSRHSPLPGKSRHSPPPTRSRQNPPTRQTRHSSRTSPSRPDHRSHSRSQSRRTSLSSVPWYNTANGKSIVDKIKVDIETYLKTTDNSGKVKTRSFETSKELTFYHSSREWIIRFINNSNKDIELKIFGERKLLAKLRPQCDVVSELTQHCPCFTCKATRPSTRQRRQGSARPNSRYANYNIAPRSPVRVASTPTPKFFEYDESEAQFGKICNDISTLILQGGNVDILRDPNSENKDIDVKFVHNRKHWNIKFPFNFPRQLPKLGYRVEYTGQRANKFIPVPLNKPDDVLRGIRDNCSCPSCKKYQRSFYRCK